MPTIVHGISLGILLLNFNIQSLVSLFFQRRDRLSLFRIFVTRRDYYGLSVQETLASLPSKNYNIFWILSNTIDEWNCLGTVLNYNPPPNTNTTIPTAVRFYTGFELSCASIRRICSRKGRVYGDRFRFLKSKMRHLTLTMFVFPFNLDFFSF